MRQYLKNYLTWDEDWIKPFESSYSVFRNLAKINGFRPIPGTLNMLLETRKTDYSDFYCTVPYKGYGVTKALRQLLTVFCLKMYFNFLQIVPEIDNFLHIGT